ncbi:hypothetical protein PG993_004015 [Apiospora rasikravindrae]|uniref:F-box domain-containing protein n=1 Tax=Apiospora rasikravindrae TaxID=990691 RepID=A0ABR1TBM3_9PEZI
MPSLTQLPWELSFQVFSYLTLRDKVRLSATCQAYRTHFAPAIFKTIRFTNDDAVARSALAAVGAYGQHTARLEFAPVAWWDDEPVVPALVPAAAELLAGRHTPHARAAQIHFDFDLDNFEQWDEGGVGLDAFADSETESEVAAKEQKWKWRALMNETWAALSENGHVRDLTVNDMIPKPTSAFRRPAFQSFLARLESATLRVWAGDHCGGWSAHLFNGYVEWLSSRHERMLGLHESFFCHMRGLRHLEIHAGPKGFLGGTGTHNIPLTALEPDILPSLRSLTLTNCLVGRELVDFIRGHAGVLTSVNVADCASLGDKDGPGEHSISWATFFDQLYSMDPPIALTELVAGGAKILLTLRRMGGHVGEDQPHPDQEEDSDLREICRQIKVQPGRKCFGYGSLHDSDGDFVRDVGRIVEGFRRGDDQRAYDCLMGLVRQNVARAASSPREDLNIVQIASG